MGIDNIVKTLTFENEEQLENMEKQADEREQEITSEYDELYKNKKAKALDNHKQTIKRDADMNLWQVKSDLKSKVLTKKQEVVDSIFSKTLDKMAKLSDEDYENFLVKLLGNLKAKEGVIIPVKGKEEVTKKALKKTEGKFELSEKSLDSKGGFVWESKEVNIDFTFERLVENLREQTELELSSALFN